MTSPTTPAIILSAEVLRFVRCEKSLERALAQRDAAAAKLPKKEAYAVQAGNPAIAEVACETLAAWTFRAGELAAVVEAHAAPVEASKAKPALAPAVPDCRVRAMRRFYAVAKTAGLNPKEVEAMKAAIAKYLSQPVPSRRDLSEGQWCELAAGVEFGLLAW